LREEAEVKPRKTKKMERETSMQISIQTLQQTSAEELQFSSQQVSATDLVKLIRKLRWIGMEEEARQLQAVLSRFPAEQAETVLGDAPSTD